MATGSTPLDYTAGRSLERSAAHRSGALRTLTIAALGVVYGDIGTSPLYAIKESFHPSYGLALTQANILGILSLVFWALTLVISFKYLAFILKADNRGEGGIMALLALVMSGEEGSAFERVVAKRAPLLIFLGLFGAALLYGDGVITPAISVLSAIEGLQVATPAFGPVVVPLTILILILLFLAQKRGTAQIGAVFGRVMLLWFVTIAVLGARWIILEPTILRAINPMWAVEFFGRNGLHGFLVLGAVVLCITGGEALYADMGHFGKGPIRMGWFWLVFPALLLNYFGQGALVLHQGTAAINNPFYGLISGWLVYPLVVLATAATVIASQALISGAFSLTQQAVQLGYFPRMAILHTSRETEGQIFVPRVNRLLMITCVLLVLIFQESSALAAAYGIAVTGTMAITSLLFLWVARRKWGWSVPQAYGLVAIFLCVDLAFFGANLVKIADGGWVPILIAGAVLTLMLTWKQGRAVLSQHMRNRAVPLQEFIAEVAAKKTHRVPGTAVFMALSRKVAPAVLLHHVRHNHCLHERVILLSILTEQVPSISARERVRVTELNDGFVEVIARYGYMEFPDISEILICAASAGLTVDINEVSFFLGRETILPHGNSGMPRWQKRIFILFSKNARTATEFFNLPPDQVTEVGAQINI